MGQNLKIFFIFSQLCSTIAIGIQFSPERDLQCFHKNFTFTIYTFTRERDSSSRYLFWAKITSIDQIVTDTALS
jgi:hypothetical protein